MKKTSNKRIIPCLTALLLTAVMLLSACSAKDGSGVRTVKSVSSRNTITAVSDDPAALHYSAGTASFSEKAASSGLIELRIDKATNTFGIFEPGKDKMWSVLPLLNKLTLNEKPASDAAMAALKIIGGTDVYMLNTQDNSVKFGKAGYEFISGGVAFNYDIFVDEATAGKSALSPSDIAFRLKIDVTLVDGSMIVECSHSNLSGNPDAYIESIDLLNYFGAYNDSAEDDFLLVPDGCGAIIRTAIFDESFEELSFAVYGSDPSVSTETSGDAVVPAFGIRHGDSAFVSLIQQGETCALIHADKASSFSDFNRVYPSFEITPVSYEKETLYISKTPSAQTLSLCYRFLFGSNAAYAGLASACREQLIRNSVLSSKSTESEDYLPFFLTVTGAARKSFGPFGYISKLTSFEQAQDMLVRMKNKGINNVALRYTGVFNGGTDQDDISGIRILSRLGGSIRLSSLYEYVSAQKMSLFLDADLISCSSGFRGGNASGINRKESSVQAENKTVEALGSTQPERKLRKVGRLSKVVTSVLTDSRQYDFSGFCFNDAGRLLYSDFSDGGALRDEAAKKISSAVTSLSTGRAAMAVRGNFYMLKNIDYIVDIPLDTTVPASGAYCPVPFIQLILHGIADYSGEPINTRRNLKESALRCVEYGACPHFEWSYEPVSEDSENDIFYYDNTINSAAEFYAEADKALSDLRNARMTDHYEVADGVFCTEYDTGSMIYVNYTDSDYSTMGVVVEARNFLRVN